MPSFSIPTKATATDAPIKNLPTLASVKLCAIENISVPTAATRAPAASNRSGPCVTDKIPVGIRMAT